MKRNFTCVNVVLFHIHLFYIRYINKFAEINYNVNIWDLQLIKKKKTSISILNDIEEL